jgi:hypothetical protein
MDKKLEKLLTKIANEHLNIETLEARNSDSLDFYDGVSALSVKDALEAAYLAGQNQPKNRS